MMRPLNSLIAILMCASLAPSALADYTQQARLSPTGGGLGATVAVSGDGNTIIVGNSLDNGQKGTVSIYARTSGTWTLQAERIAPTDLTGLSHFGSAVALSTDGSVAAVGASGDTSGNGGTWIFTRAGANWTQQGSRLFGTGGVAGPGQGASVALAADGTLLFVGGPGDNFAAGALWIFARSGNSWAQQGNKLVGTGGVAPFVSQGAAVAASSDGSTVIVGANGDASATGAAWIFIKSGNGWVQQGNKLVGAGAVAAANQSISVAVSGDGNTAIIGHPLDNSGAGAAWVFTRSNGTWTQQAKLTGTDGTPSAQEGTSVGLSADGNTAAIGGPDDHFLKGAAWVFKRNGNSWTQQGSKLVGTGGGSFQGGNLALSPDAGTLAVAGAADAWIFSGPSSAIPAPAGVAPGSGAGTTQVFTFNFSDSGGWQRFTILDVLVNNALDGRQACYVAVAPTGPNAASVYLIDDAGDAGGPYSGMVLPSSDSVANSQCTISGAGSSVVAGGNNVTLNLAITFAPAFAGNRIFYVAAQDAGANSGWQPMATWHIPGTTPTGPSVTSVTNAHSTGLTQTYTFTFSDTNGWQDLTVTNVLINSAINGVGACYVAFAPMGANSGAVYLVDDAGDGAGPYAGMMLPTSGPVSNSQCSISGANSSVVASGNTVQLTLAVTFTPAFGGNRILFAAAGSATKNSGWQAVGTVGVQ